MDLSATLGGLIAGLRDRIERAGAPGIIGLALMAFSAAFALGGLQPLREELTGLEEREQRLSRLPARGAAKQTAAGTPFARDLELPSAHDALPQVMRLTELAEQRGLKLSQGDYRLHRDREAGVSAYQMHYPVAGSYVALRQFINDALDQFPALALEEVIIRRNTIGAADVEARLRFTLYLKDR